MLNKCISLSCSSQVLCARSFSNFVAPLWTGTSTSMSFLQCSCAFKIYFLENIQPSWTPSSLRTVPRDSINLSPKQARLCPIQKSKVALLLSLLLTSWELKTNYCIQNGLQTPVAHKPFSVCITQAQQGAFLCWLTHQLCQEVILHTLQEPPRRPPLCCFLSVQRHHHWIHWITSSSK